MRRQIEPELSQGLVKLSSVDRPAAVRVKMTENPLPILDVFPESRELVEGNRSATIGIEDGHEQFDGVEIERRPISVHESLLKFMRRDAAAPICIDRREPLP